MVKERNNHSRPEAANIITAKSRKKREEASRRREEQERQGGRKTLATLGVTAVALLSILAYDISQEKPEKYTNTTTIKIAEGYSNIWSIAESITDNEHDVRLTVDEIRKLNPEVDPSVLHMGQVIEVPENELSRELHTEQSSES